MKVLFLTLVQISTLEERGIYQDLLRKFRDEGHDVYVVSPSERRLKKPTTLSESKGATFLQVKTLNIQKTNILEKGIGTIAIEYQYLNAIKKHLTDVKFDLILYSTPPITLTRVINYIKKRDGAYSYLLLKDIFPQNAVDMGMMRRNTFLYNFFVKKERQLYQLSDTIGCMSPANCRFILSQNSTLPKQKIEVNPNSIDPIKMEPLNNDEKRLIRNKSGLPMDKTIFVYGGNLGKPQGLDFLLDTISNADMTEAYFLVIGNGTEFDRMQNWFLEKQPENAMLLSGLPKVDYDNLLRACDVGMIFLDKAFTIPNFPSRLLSYLEMKMPVVAATDPNSDIGDLLVSNGCGFKVLSGDLDSMVLTIHKLLHDVDLMAMGEQSWQLLQRDYLVERSYELIMDKLKINHV